MLPDDVQLDVLFIVDTSTISQIFKSFYPRQFPSFWERFDHWVSDGRAISVRSVRSELERTLAEPSGAVSHIEHLSPDFFAEPGDSEQSLVKLMTDNPHLSAAANRWRSKVEQGREDADPYLIAKAMTLRALDVVTVVITEESQDLTKIDRIPAVCGHFGVPCMNLQQLMEREGWQF